MRVGWRRAKCWRVERICVREENREGETNERREEEIKMNP